MQILNAFSVLISGINGCQLADSFHLIKLFVFHPFSKKKKKKNVLIVT